MSTQRNKVDHVTTITRVVIELGVDEDWLWDIAGEREPEDGLIGVCGPGHDAVMAFSEDSIKCRQGLIAIHKAHPETNQE